MQFKKMKPHFLLLRLANLIEVNNPEFGKAKETLIC